MNMDELLDQIRELCAGKTVEEIEQDLSEATVADRIPNANVLARHFFAISNEPEEESAVGPDDEPTADVDID